jgi:hypothetical protein
MFVGIQAWSDPDVGDSNMENNEGKVKLRKADTKVSFCFYETEVTSRSGRDAGCQHANAARSCRFASLNALTFTADQHTGHALRSLASFGQRGIRTVPARVVGVMSGGAPFAVIALSAT